MSKKLGKDKNIIDKNIINETSIGCLKLAVNLFIEKIDNYIISINNKLSKDPSNNILIEEKKEYEEKKGRILNNLGLKESPKIDRPSNKDYIKRGELTEIRKIKEICSIPGYSVISGYDKKNNIKELENFLDNNCILEKINSSYSIIKVDKSTCDEYEAICIQEINNNDYNEEETKKYYDDDRFNVDEYNIVKAFQFQFDTGLNSVIDIFKKMKANNIIYQFKINLGDEFIEFLSKKYNINDEVKNTFTFSSFILDFVRILPKNIVCEVLDENNNIVKSNNEKYKIQVCDVKTSKDDNKYSLEVCIYILALNYFIISKGLDKDFEVISNGLILKDFNKFNESNKIINEFEDIKQKVIPFSNYEYTVKKLLENDLMILYETIMGIDISHYYNFIISPKCNLCGYYGGQVLKEDTYIVKDMINKLMMYFGKTEDEINENLVSYFDKYNEDNCYETGFCRYIVRNVNNHNLNKLHYIPQNSKRRLHQNKIYDITELALVDRIKNEDIIITNDKSLMAEKSNILRLNKLHNINTTRGRKVYDVMYKGKKITRNLPCSVCNLTIFIDIEKDANDNFITFSFLCLTRLLDGKLPVHYEPVDGYPKYRQYTRIKVLKSNDILYTKREFIDFLIKINEEIEYIYRNHNVDSSYKQDISYSIQYFGIDALKSFKDIFSSVFDYIIGAKDINDLGYENGIIYKKRKALDEVKLRFGAMFEKDNHIQDNEIILNSPLFDLKEGLKDILILNDYMAENLISYTEVILKRRIDTKKRYHIPDRDKLNGFVTSRLFSVYMHNYKMIKPNTIIEEYEQVIKNRLDAMKDLYIWIKEKPDIKGTRYAPKIKAKSKNELENQQINEMYYSNLLEVAFNTVDAEINLNMEINKKNASGKCIILEEIIDYYESSDEIKMNILKSKYPNITFDKSNKIYAEYKLNSESVITKLDTKDIFLTMYPSDKLDYIYKKFIPLNSSKNNDNNSIYYDPEDDDIIKYTEVCNRDGISYYNLLKRDKGKYEPTKKHYLELINISIEYIDRNNKKIIISYNKAMKYLLNLLEEQESFNFTQNIVVETFYKDINSEEINKILESIDANETKQKLIIDPKYAADKIDSLNKSELKDIQNLCDRLDESQINAIINSLEYRVNLIWGPPGTGKSTTITNLLNVIYNYRYKNLSKKVRILVMGNYNAIDTIIASIIDKNLLDYEDVNIYRFRSDYNLFPNKFTVRENIKDVSKTEFENKFTDYINANLDFEIFTATNYKIAKEKKLLNIEFDYVIVDESSQIKLIDFSPAIIASNDKTHFIIAGDDKQLKYISKVPSKHSKKQYLNSVYDFFKSIKVITSPLLVNRRSNDVIVNFGKEVFGYDKNYGAGAQNKNRKIELLRSNEYLSNPVYDLILNPELPLVLIEHNEDLSTMQNEFEADIIIDSVIKIWDSGLIKEDMKKEFEDIQEFFYYGVGIVVPHRAQKIYIQTKLAEIFIKKLSYDKRLIAFKAKHKHETVDKIIRACEASIDTIEKYQGDERMIIFGSYILSDLDRIKTEAEFIFEFRRLNVMVSRARCKAVVICSKNLMNYLSPDDEVDEMHEYLLKLKDYCNSGCEVIEYGDKVLECSYKSFTK